MRRKPSKPVDPTEIKKRGPRTAEDYHPIILEPDTRTWQQKFLGDPDPSRSALKRKPA